MRCPNRVLCVHQPSAVPSAGGVLVVAACVFVEYRWWWCFVWWSGTWLWLVLRGYVRWGSVLSCEMSCHVLSIDVMCFFVLCHVTQYVMQCDVMWCGLMWWAFIWCEVMQWDGMLWACDAMWLAVRSRCVIRSGCVMWRIGRWCGYWYFKVLQLHCSTKCFSVVQIFALCYKVLLCTTKKYSFLQSNTKYYTVLLRTTN